MGAMADSTKKNLPLLRAVKEGKREVITALIESDEVDVNFQNHCACHAPAAREGGAWCCGPPECACCTLTTHPGRRSAAD